MIPLLFMCRRDRRAAFALAFSRLMAPTEHTCLEVTDTYFDTNEMPVCHMLPHLLAKGCNVLLLRRRFDR